MIYLPHPSFSSKNQHGNYLPCVSDFFETYSIGAAQSSFELFSKKFPKAKCTPRRDALPSGYIDLGFAFLREDGAELCIFYQSASVYGQWKDVPGFDPFVGPICPLSISLEYIRSQFKDLLGYLFM